MAMGMGSNKKRSNVGVVVVWCLVLGLALLVAEAAGKDISYCQDLCRGRPYFQYIHCIDVCMLSSGHGAAARLAGNRRTAGEEGRVGGVGLGGRAGLLAIPAERPGREVEEKTKQEDAGHLTEPHGDAAYCSAFCNGRSDFGPCYNECLYGRVTGQEEARGGGGSGGRAGLLAMPTERAGREGEEKRRQEDLVVRLTDPVWCYDTCREHPELDYTQCVKDCYTENMPDTASVAHERIAREEARGGGEGDDALTAAAGRLTYSRCRGFVDCFVKPCVWRCMRQAGGLRFGAHGREVEEEARGGGGADGEAKAKGGGRVVQLAFEPGTAAYCREFCEYEWDFATCNIKCLGKKEEIHVGGRAGPLAMPTERAGREEEEKRKKGT